MSPAAEEPGESPAKEREVIEVVAEPMTEEPAPGGAASATRRLRRGLGPVVAGIIIDVVDLTTFVPVVGFSLGSLSGLWLAGRLGFPLRRRVFAGLACGVYCMFPPTGFFPLATLLGVWANLHEQDEARASSG